MTRLLGINAGRIGKDACEAACLTTKENQNKTNITPTLYAI
jgi:hypothetical protein